ncbi:MAG: NADH-quinone oxidoreductase subunit C [Candidatus Omnitrophica bacterium]|nr:NADH-quinone oxidoreductase subunit C [Candidatus Omnitrophota bacterium]
MSNHYFQLLRERFPESILEGKVHSPKRVYLTVKKESLVEVAKFVFRVMDARFSTASAVDCLDRIEILYHFSLDSQDVFISLRVVIPRERPAVPSLSGVIKGAAWIEREMHELFGVNFEGHPRLNRLLLPEDWPENVYPLRKDNQDKDIGKG